MVSVPRAIGFLFPAAIPLSSYVVSDDGTGPKITYWSPSLGKQPTQAELDAVTQEQVDAARKVPGFDIRTIEGCKKLISAIRYENETAGIEIEGQQFSTERDEIGHWYPRFSNAWGWLNNDPVSRKGNPGGIYPYKPKKGKPVILTPEQVIRAYDRVAFYINSCFGVESYLYGLLDAGTPVEQVTGMLTQVWPTRQYLWNEE